MQDSVSSIAINGLLPKALREMVDIKFEKTVTSTNSLLKESGKAGAKEGAVLISDSQTEGRGRLGRSFFSPEGTGIYMSILLKPSIAPEDTVLITTAAAVSVCNALKRLDVSGACIKWVNDIFLNGKKVCGILTEGSISGKESVDFAVLGLGINIYNLQGEFPDDLKNIAGGIFKEEKENLKNQFIAYFLTDFFKLYEDILSRKHLKEYEKLCFVIGKEISFVRNGELCTAKAVGISENCGLRIIKDNGKSDVLSSGEVSLKI